MPRLWDDPNRAAAELDQLIHDAAAPTRGPEQARNRPWLTARKDDTGWLLQVDLPGVPAGDVEVKVEDDVLRIGARRTRAPPAGARALRCERIDWSFEHTLELPPIVDPEAVRARLHHGRLHLHLPLRAASTREVPVETS